MLFYSPFSNFVQVVRHETKIPHPTLPTFIGEIKRLAAEFGKLEPEFDYVDPDGVTRKGVNIRGHYFDSVIAQEENGWTDEEREEVEQVLIQQSVRNSQFVRVIEKTKAPAPWPTYDTTHFSKIVDLAASLGLVSEALQYELENRNRESVVGGLREKLAAAAEAAETELAVA